jgi:hypothetical protein
MQLEELRLCFLPTAADSKNETELFTLNLVWAIKMKLTSKKAPYDVTSFPS